MFSLGNARPLGRRHPPKHPLLKMALGARTTRLFGVRAPLSNRAAKLGSGKRRQRWDRGAFFLRSFGKPLSKYWPTVTRLRICRLLRIGQPINASIQASRFGPP